MKQRCANLGVTDHSIEPYEFGEFRYPEVINQIGQTFDNYRYNKEIEILELNRKIEYLTQKFESICPKVVVVQEISQKDVDKAVYIYLKENKNGAFASDIAENLGISVEQVLSSIQSLKKAGKIE
ncbi:MAG: helix-turn-helix domain-containing protein [Nanoarchaeota archaeon]|nr:helix-turn-helix domain-containing protein [Nanoarchaeota archaeon]